MTDVFYKKGAKGEQQLEERLDGDVLINEDLSNSFFHRKPVRIGYRQRIEVPTDENLQVSVNEKDEVEILKTQLGSEEIKPEEAANIIEDENIVPQEDIFVEAVVEIDRSPLYRGGPDGFLSKNLYDGNRNSLKEKGATIPEAESFIQRRKSFDNPFNLAEEFFKNLYDERGISHISDSQDAMDVKDVLNNFLEDDAYEYNIFKSFREGAMICDELSVLTSYVFRNSSFPAKPSSVKFRYRENENGVSIADSRGDEMLPHKTSFVWDRGKWNVVDASIYFHSREDGLSHEESFEKCINRYEDGVYYTESTLTDPFRYKSKEESKESEELSVFFTGEMVDKSVEEYTSFELL